MSDAAPLTPEETRGVLPDGLFSVLCAIEQFERGDPLLRAKLHKHIAEHMTDEEVEQISAFAWGLVGFFAEVEFDVVPEERARSELRGHMVLSCQRCAARPSGCCIVCSAPVDSGRWTCSESCSHIVKQADSLRFKGQSDALKR